MDNEQMAGWLNEFFGSVGMPVLIADRVEAYKAGAVGAINFVLPRLAAVEAERATSAALLREQVAALTARISELTAAAAAAGAPGGEGDGEGTQGTQGT